MRIYLIFIIVFLVCFQPREGITSKIYYDEATESIDDMAKNVDLVVFVKNLDQTQLYREEKIPMKAMGQPEEMFIYREQLQLFEVKKVLKPGLGVTEGDVIKTWKEPDYDYEMVRMYYEDGISKSPIVRRQTPLFAIEQGDDLILFLNDKDFAKHIFQHYAMQGPAGLETVEKAIKNIGATP